jgi:hypothetical protein
MPERLNLKVGVMNEKNGLNKPNQHITLEQVIALIESKYQDPDTRDRLIQKAKQYPRGAMSHFVREYIK